MGVEHVYANQDKAQYFYCARLHYSAPFSAIGFGPGARALAILLSPDGSWSNDRISVIPHPSREFDKLFARGTDIGVEVDLMLINVDGLEWVEWEVEEFGSAFNQMCAFALVLRHPKVAAMLDRKFGAGKWQRRYEKNLQGNSDLWTQRIVDARARGLSLLI